MSIVGITGILYAGMVGKAVDGIAGMESVGSIVGNVSGTVSYTHLTLPTKRIV